MTKTIAPRRLILLMESPLVPQTPGYACPHPAKPGSLPLNGSYWPGLDDEAGQMYPFMLRTNGKIVIDFGDMVKVPYRPFDEESKRRDLQRRLNGINGVQIPDAKLDGWPNFEISALAEPEALAEFIRIMEWTFDESEESAARRCGLARARSERRSPRSGAITGAHPWTKTVSPANSDSARSS
jgi:hypothetical protein